MKFSTLAPCLVMACLSAPVAQAQSEMEPAVILGRAAFSAHCVSCHGTDATGNGPEAENLEIKPTDLTMLSENSGGAFPFSEVYQLIDGRKMSRTHGDSGGMPVWGDYFSKDSMMDKGISVDDLDHIVQGRILSLVYYLQTIQQ